jgi:hypothetical protein
VKLSLVLVFDLAFTEMLAISCQASDLHPDILVEVVLLMSAIAGIGMRDVKFEHLKFYGVNG